jgi:hypothetical protein
MASDTLTSAQVLVLNENWRRKEATFEQMALLLQARLEVVQAYIRENVLSTKIRKRWGEWEQDLLKKGFEEGLSCEEIAWQLGREPEAVANEGRRHALSFKRRDDGEDQDTNPSGNLGQQAPVLITLPNGYYYCPEGKKLHRGTNRPV